MTHGHHLLTDAKMAALNDVDGSRYAFADRYR